MKKTILLIIISLVLINVVSALEECESVMETNDIPCLILLPYTGNCTTMGMRFYNNGSTLLDDRIMAQFNPFYCNQTFNFTTFGSYTFNYSTGDTGSILVQGDENQQYYLYIVALIVFFVLAGIGYWLDEGVFIMVSGVLAMVIGINLHNYGFPNLTNDFLRQAIVLVIWGVGAYLILVPAMKFFEEWRDKP